VSIIISCKAAILITTVKILTVKARKVTNVIIYNTAILIIIVKMFTVQAHRATNVNLNNTAILITMVKMFTVQAPISVTRLLLRVSLLSQDRLIHF
jgi:hypothetical protein